MRVRTAIRFSTVFVGLLVLVACFGTDGDGGEPPTCDEVEGYIEDCGFGGSRGVICDQAWTGVNQCVGRCYVNTPCASLGAENTGDLAMCIVECRVFAPPSYTDAGAQVLEVLDLQTAHAGAVLARVCSIVSSDEPVCTDVLQQTAFVEMMDTIRALLPEPAFQHPAEFVALVEGEGRIYELLLDLVGPDHPSLQWTPVTLLAGEGEVLETCLVASGLPPDRFK